MTIFDKYRQACSQESDIYQHLPTLKKYADECPNLITEMGVRSVVSTWAFLQSRRDHGGALVSFDLERSPNLAEALKLAELEKVRFDFWEENVLGIQIEPTELLFIDTWHTYTQLKQELALHAPKVSNYIILHDTETFGTVGEDGKDKGLNFAVDEFLQANHDWYIKEKFTNNNGLTVLAKYPV